MLANMTLDGLEETVRRAVPRRVRVNFIRYADDFIITGKSRRLLEVKVKPAIEKFLAERGLTLSKEKTVITHIKKRFTFLGQNFRKHGRKLHITPSIEGVLALIREVGMLIIKYVGAPMVGLIKKLNDVLRGWAYYHRHVVSSEIFGRIDTYVFEQLRNMLRKRHWNKSKKWLLIPTRSTISITGCEGIKRAANYCRHYQHVNTRQSLHRKQHNRAVPQGQL